MGIVQSIWDRFMSPERGRFVRRALTSFAIGYAVAIPVPGLLIAGFFAAYMTCGDNDPCPPQPWHVYIPEILFLGLAVVAALVAAVGFIRAFVLFGYAVRNGLSRHHLL